MKLTLGIIGIMAGIVLGVYVGLWVCLIGGIMGLITALVTFIKVGAILYSVIGVSLLKIFLASILGWASAMFLIAPSMGLIFSIKN